MNFTQSFKLAIKSLMLSKMRALLTMLGIIIGVAAVIIITSLGNGMQNYMNAQFEQLGSNLIQVMVYGRGEESTRDVSPDDMYALVEKYPQYLSGVSPYVTAAVVSGERHIHGGGTSDEISAGLQLKTLSEIASFDADKPAHHRIGSHTLRIEAYGFAVVQILLRRCSRRCRFRRAHGCADRILQGNGLAVLIVKFRRGAAVRIKLRLIHRHGQLGSRYGGIAVRTGVKFVRVIKMSVVASL